MSAASADVAYEQGSHPAYERILADLAPDKARILRLIAERGPQAAVDVRSGLAFVPGSRLVAQGYTMIGAEAGCRFVDQVPAYLSNLHRLGLIWFSRDPVTDNERYQVLEVQPDVLEAVDEAGRFSHVVRRSIRMTPLGKDFCRVALPLETAEIEALEYAVARLEDIDEISDGREPWRPLAPSATLCFQAAGTAHSAGRAACPPASTRVHAGADRRPARVAPPPPASISRGRRRR